MDLRLDAFMAKYEGKKIDFDGVYGAQCVDVVKYWEQTIGAQITHGNAKEYKSNADRMPNDYKWVRNTRTSVPIKGDIIVWNIGRWGHVGIFIRGDSNKFWSFDQNYPVGSPCKVVEHNYSGVIGYLRPKALDVSPTPKPDPKDILISKLEKEIQVLKETIQQLERDKANLIQGSKDKDATIQKLEKDKARIQKEYNKQLKRANLAEKQLQAKEEELLECQEDTKPPIDDKSCLERILACVTQLIKAFISIFKR